MQYSAIYNALSGRHKYWAQHEYSVPRGSGSVDKSAWLAMDISEFKSRKAHIFNITQVIYRYTIVKLWRFDELRITIDELYKHTLQKLIISQTENAWMIYGLYFLCYS